MHKKDAADAFGSLHPGAGFLLFGLAVLLTVLFMHPAVLGVSFCCASAYALYLRRKKALRFLLCVLLPVMVLSAVLNPAFNHRGATILFYLSTGNPVTAESLYYGAGGSLMIGSVLMWFYCYNAVMDSDKLIWLLGRPAPALALIISMALRLVPRYTVQAKRVAVARAGLGRGVNAGGIISRARDGLTILSTMTTWALENAVDTADSMTSRGFGLKGRTAYSNYRLDRRSASALIVLALAGAACVVLAATGAVGVSYFPRFELSGPFAVQVAMIICWAAICAFPVVLDVWEDARFKRALSAQTVTAIRQDQTQNDETTDCVKIAPARHCERPQEPPPTKPGLRGALRGARQSIPAAYEHGLPRDGYAIARNDAGGHNDARGG